MRLAYDHPTNAARLAVLDKTAAELGVTVNQVVLAWMLAASDPPIIPIPGASTVAQLEEILAATELTLDPAILDRLNDRYLAPLGG
jgi:aryl-alcohol dehydrogenase-like predicted oxidoreductase